MTAATLARNPGPARRIAAILLRHYYLARSSPTRLFDLMYWPLLQMVVWGFITVFLARHSSWVVQAGGVLIGGVLLWDVLVRGQFGMTLSLLEEMWSRNLANLFVSPLRPVEFAGALMVLSMLRSLVGVIPASLLAIPLFAYSIFDLGLPLLAFWAVLTMFGWGVGLMISAALIRFGLAAESYAWASIFVLAPISGVYYPIDTLPPWLRVISWALPSTHVFEGMRALMIDHAFRWDLLASALALNAVYLAAGLGLFLLAFESARQRGQLLHAGE
jgi:ABC-2 type transport system permease protein